MKNYLVILVTVGIGIAYWYQIPEPPKPVAAAAVATPAPVVVKPPFVASRTSLDEPPSRVGSHHSGQLSVLIGNDKPSHLHP